MKFVMTILREPKGQKQAQPPAVRLISSNSRPKQTKLQSLELLGFPQLKYKIDQRVRPSSVTAIGWNLGLLRSTGVENPHTWSWCLALPTPAITPRDVNQSSRRPS